MQDVYKNIGEYNPEKKHKLLIVFDEMIGDKIVNKKFNPVVTELFVKDRKLNILLVFIKQLQFKVPKDVRVNFTHYFILEIPSEIELQRTAINDS